MSPFSSARGFHEHSFTTCCGQFQKTFESLGRITRQLHEAMTGLGLEQGLLAVTQEIPDIRDRPSHVGQMTEVAAKNVLTMINLAQPKCHQFKSMSDCFSQVLRQVQSGPHPGTDAIHGLLLARFDVKVIA